MSETPTSTSDIKRAVREAKKQAGEVSDAAQDLMAKPSTAPLGPPVRLRGHYARPSKISPIRQ